MRRWYDGIVSWFDVLGAVDIAGMLSAGKWITLKNGKRLKLDADGRIVAGMPAKYHGVHVADLTKLSHQERELEGIDCEDLRTHCHTCKKTFKTRDEAFLALLDANPQLDALRTSEFGQYDLAFLKWQRNGRRGAKPTTPITDGRLDAINEYYDLRGRNRVGSMTEAIYHAIPPSHRWEDLEARLTPLEEMAGIKVNLPDEALRLSVAKKDAAQCADEVDARLTALFEAAKAGRLEEPAPPAGDGVPVPF